MSLPRLSIRRPVAVAMFFAAVVMLGVLSITRLPIDLLPDIAYPRLVVYTGYPDVAPAEVERFVTERVERVVQAVPGVERVESVSREGVSLVTLRFAWGTDMDFAALNVREKLDALRNSEDGAGFPELAERPIVLRTDPTSEPILAVSVSGRDDLWALKDLSESVIKRRLEQIDGVAQAAVVGGLEREIAVEVNPQLLDSYGVTAEQVSAALAAANQSAPGGTIRRGRYRYALRTLGEFGDVRDLESVVVARQGGGQGTGAGAGSQGETGGANAGGADAGAVAGTVFLRDVARVTDGFRERESITRHDGREAIGLLLFKESGANTVRVAERVEDVLTRLREQYPEVTIVVATSQAGFISDSIANVVQEVVLGGILAFLVLFLFLRDVRVPVAIALAIPISIVTTFALFDAAGVSINIMSLGGLALGVGLLMDNSIVVVENIFRQRELGLAPVEAASVGTEEVQRAIAASTLTTIAVFGPIVYVQGVAGELFSSLSFAVAFALGASVFVAVSLLPALASRWREGAKAPGREGEEQQFPRALAPSRPRTLVSRFLDRFEAGFAAFGRWYERQLEWALDHRGVVLGGAAVLLVCTALITWALPRSVLPEVDQGEFRVALTLPRGTPLERTAETEDRISRILRADPGVEAVFSRIGRQAAVAGVDDASGLHTALLDVRLHDGVTANEVVRRLRPQLAPFGGSVAVETGHATALGKLLGGGEADLAVRVRGDDLEAALAYAAQVETRLRDLRAVTNVRVGTELGHPEMRVHVDRERAASYGIEPRLVAETVERYMKGDKATDFVDFDRKVPVVVRLPEADRRSLDALLQIRLSGVPMRELIRVEEGVGPTEVRRVDQARVVAVLADVTDGDLTQAVGAIRSALDAVPTPRGLQVEIGGENEEMQRSFAALSLAMLLALLLVYMILAAEFESLLHPFIVLLAVPLATLGASIALLVTGNGLNVVSLIGMVVLIGIVDNDAVVKIDFINQMRARGHSVRQSILEAGHARLRPILINSITAMLGLLPMALGIGPGAQLQAPMAVAVFGGLFTATALTLVVIPVAYSVAEDVRAWLRGALGRRAAASPVVMPEPTAGD
jgi:HAE1 family hydrophobic/amphiphilic exporter-1